MSISKLPLEKQLVERASFFYRKRSTKEGDRAWRDAQLLYASAALLRQQHEALVGLLKAYDKSVFWLDAEDVSEESAEAAFKAREAIAAAEGEQS